MKFQAPYTDEFIEAYLNGTLDEQALVTFEKAMQEQDELAQYVVEYQHLLQGLQAYGKQHLQKRIQHTEKKLNEEGFFMPDEEIEDYLIHQPQQVEQLIKQHPQLEARIAERRSLISAIEQKGEQDNRAKIQKVEAALAAEGFFEGNATSSPKRLTPFRLGYCVAAAAAVLLLLILAGQFLLNQPSDYQHYFILLDENISEQVELELSEEGFAGEPDPSLQQLAKALDFYQNERFDQAIPLFQAYLQATDEEQYQQNAQFYLAISLLGSQKPKAALSLLEELDFPAQQATINWYLALAYLETEQPQAAKKLLMQLSKHPSYKEKAQQLLTQIQ